MIIWIPKLDVGGNDLGILEGFIGRAHVANITIEGDDWMCHLFAIRAYFFDNDLDTLKWEAERLYEAHERDKKMVTAIDLIRELASKTGGIRWYSAFDLSGKFHIKNKGDIGKLLKHYEQMDRVDRIGDGSTARYQITPIGRKWLVDQEKKIEEAEARWWH